MTIKVRGNQPSASADKNKILSDRSVKNISSTLAQALAQSDAITGRGLFVVHILENAVSVESAFLADDGKILRMPAVFPNREYALEQVEELR
jgi:hypothetical protein